MMNKVLIKRDNNDPYYFHLGAGEVNNGICTKFSIWCSMISDGFSDLFKIIDDNGNIVDSWHSLKKMKPGEFAIVELNMNFIGKLNGLAWNESLNGPKTREELDRIYNGD